MVYALSPIHDFAATIWLTSLQITHLSRLHKQWKLTRSDTNSIFVKLSDQDEWISR